MATKLCNYCFQEKEIAHFPARGARCNSCMARWLREHRRKQREAYLLLNPPQPKAVVTHKVCPMCSEDKPIEQFNFANRGKGIRSTYCKPCQSKRSYQDKLKRGNPLRENLKYRCNKFGIDLATYDSFHSEQNGVCALCENHETHPVTKGGKARRLAIDHDHEAGTVRGLLCFRCNTALHQLEKHGLQWADKAVQYLRKYQET